jgi:membrane protein CcdC involved in cytochrome C biogenesis
MFENIPSQFWIIASTIFAVIMGSFVLVMRLKSQLKPVTAKKIMIPPIAMSTGALMFLFEVFRPTPIEVVQSIAVGLVFSFILIKTSKFEWRGEYLYLKASKAFPFILIGLLILRIVLKQVLATTIDIGQLGGMFFILAFFMLAPWRLAMLLQYKKLVKQKKSYSYTEN